MLYPVHKLHSQQTVHTWKWKLKEVIMAGDKQVDDKISVEGPAPEPTSRYSDLAFEEVDKVKQEELQQ